MRILAVVLTGALIGSAAPAEQQLQMVVLEGDKVINSLSNRRAQDLLVEVRDANRKPADGAHITVVLPERGAGGTFDGGATVQTARAGADGKARFSGLHLRPLAGEFPIRLVAAYQGQTTSLTATQKVEAAPVRSGNGGLWRPRNVVIMTVAGAGIAAALAAFFYDNDKGPNASGFQANPGTPAVTGPR